MAKDSFAYLKGRKAIFLTEYSSEEEKESSFEVYSGGEDDVSDDDSEDDILIQSSQAQSDSENVEVSEDVEIIPVSGDDVSDSNDISLHKGFPSDDTDLVHAKKKNELASAFSLNASNVIQQRDMARKVQTMKSSLFSASTGKKEVLITDNSLFGREPLGFELKGTKMKDQSFDKACKREKIEFSPERREMDARIDFEYSVNNESLLSSPKKYRRSFPFNNAAVIPILSKSVLNGNEKQIADASFFMSRSFRAGWGGTVFVKIR